MLPACRSVSAMENGDHALVYRLTFTLLLKANLFQFQAYHYPTLNNEIVNERLVPAKASSSSY